MYTSKKKRLLAILGGFTIAFSSGMAADHAVAQGIGDAIKGAVKDSIQPSAANASGTGSAVSGQTAADRGVNRAVQGVLQGETSRAAVNSGLREGMQTATETSQQTQQRDLLQRQQVSGNQLDGQGLQNSGQLNGQSWQRDSQGRFFYQDATGQTVYANAGVTNGGQTQQPVATTVPNGTRWQRDAQGRTFYRDAQGNSVYSSQSMQAQPNAQEGSGGQASDSQQRYQAKGQIEQTGKSVSQALVGKLTKASQAEIELAQLAKDQSQNSEVQEYADVIIQDCRALNMELEKVSSKNESRASVIANQNDSASRSVPEQLCKIADLACDNSLAMTKEMFSNYEGQDFDMAFLGQQCMAHTILIAELKAIQDEGPEVMQQLAADAASKAQQHLEKAKQLTAQLSDAKGN